MFSKRLSLLLILLLPACSLKLNDQVTKPVSSINTGSGCLAKAGDVLDRFTKGTLSETEHEEFYSCLNRALSTFANHADGKSKEHFEPEELGNFLSKYFLKGRDIQPALLHEAMALKRAFVGGSPDHISRQELRRIIQLFGALKMSTGKMRSIMPFQVESFAARGFSPEQFEEAIKTFETAITSFGDQIKTEQQTYSFDRLSALIIELRTFMYQEKVPDDHWTLTLLRMSEVIRPAKVIFLSAPRNEITASDWPKIFHLAPRYYAAFLRGQFYLHSALSSFSASGLQRVERAYSHFVEIFDFVLEQHVDRAISSAEIDDLIQTLHSQEMLGCQPETARAFVKAAFGRLLGGPFSADSFSVNKDSLNRFKESFHYGLEGLHAIEALYRGRFEKKSGPAIMSREEIAAVSMEQLLEATTLKNALSREAAEDVKATPANVRTVFPGNSNSVKIPLHGESPKYSLQHMIRVHGLRTINRLLIQAYGDSKKAELSETQLAAFMNDIFPIMLEWRLVDAETRTSLGKRLFEASLFLYSSDGNKGLTAKEALELESLLISTMSYAPLVHKRLYLEAMKSCETLQIKEKEKVIERSKMTESQLKEDDKKEKNLIPADCYRTDFIKNTEIIWGYIPGLAKHVTDKPQREQEELFDRMANFLRKGKAKADDYKLADTQAFILLPYYIELLFARFDANGDGFFDNTEAEAAYPVFQPFLAAKSAEKGYTDDKTHRAIYNFLLAYRQLPTDDKWGFVVRRYLLGDKNFRVDRGQVVEIFDKLMSL